MQALGVSICFEDALKSHDVLCELEKKQQEIQFLERSELIKCSKVLLFSDGIYQDQNDEALPSQLIAGQILIGLFNPYLNRDYLQKLSSKLVDMYSLASLPRISRAQSMDMISSQASLAGYKAVLKASDRINRVLPMMMSAAGNIMPLKVFVLGVGVAGLQAIATAKRLGANVIAYDIRPEVKEQVESLGASFLDVKLNESDEESEGGYAKEVSKEGLLAQQEALASQLSQAHIVITTAVVPGKKAPLLLTKLMIERMPRGAVIVDMAAAWGGNCEGTTLGESITTNGVILLGEPALHQELAIPASDLIAENLASFLELLIQGGALVEKKDPILDACLIATGSKLLSREKREQKKEEN